MIVPALGPLTVGHVLVISTGHTAGLRYLPAEIQQNYEEFFTRIRGYCGWLGDGVLEAEHGARDIAVRGPCIRHTHVHILPRLAEATRLFCGNSAMSRMESGVANNVDSYIRVNDGRRECAYDASRVIGQEIRQTIGRYLMIDDWDWAVNPKPEVVAGTIKYWSRIRQWLD
jgi:diadenosine tetraphosphate (Ap4A) HIT family hydrolase